ncbi:MAG: pantothenate kinase [Micavibrio sp.]|nr:pantothenate kinase [Micavibrio sp.]|tara:strand:+ start:596 stop:1363 length:768 start_codon:yes stop_codon:yes gene_type:complete
MLLVIDIGNTNTVFAVFDGDVLTASYRCVTNADKTADEYAAFFFGLSKTDIKNGDITSILVSSVVPETHIHMRQFCKHYLRTDPVFISANMLDIKVDLDKPDEIGADRLVNTAAVIEHYQTPAIVIDFGTATTFDVIGAGGVYQGGAIAPGINLSLNALAQAAAKLPKINFKKPENVIGTSTISAMHSGIYWGYVGLIEGIITRAKKELGNDNCMVIATGGLARVFEDDVTLINLVDSDLTLKGLHAISKTMKSK